MKRHQKIDKSEKGARMNRTSQTALDSVDQQKFNFQAPLHLDGVILCKVHFRKTSSLRAN